MERLGKMNHSVEENDKLVEKIVSNSQPQAQPEQPKKSWKQWLTGK